MSTKRMVLASATVFLLVLSFWLGRITSHGEKKGESSHDQGPTPTAASGAESASHEHAPGKVDDHAGAKNEPSGLQLSSAERSNIGLKSVEADLRRLDAVIRVAGVVKPHPDREAQVSSRVSGKIVNLFFKVGDAIKKGQRLAEIQSVEIQKLQVDLIQAENKLKLAKAEHDRIQRLVESKIAAQKELIAAQNHYQGIVNEIEGLTEQLVLLGLSRDEVTRVRAERTIATFTIPSPMSGVVVERNVVLGETVEPNKTLFKILDPLVVSVEGEAFEEALSQLRVKQEVRIRLAAFPGEIFSGKISRFSPMVDPQKRTVHLWAEVSNRTGKLRPNLFADMDVVVGGGKEVLAIPLEAVISSEGGSFVFTENKGFFRRVDVVLGIRDDRYVEVKQGLLPGDLVVTDGKQQVYTKSLIARQGGAALGGHGH